MSSLTGPLHASVAAVDIRPPKSLLPQWLDGFGERDSPSWEAYQPLWVRAIRLRAGDGEVILLAAEVLGFDPRRVDKLKQRVAAAARVTPSQVALLATHTHCAPRVIEGMFMPGTVDRRYVEWFEDRCVEAVTQCGPGVPVQALFSRGVDLLGVNRRRWVENAVQMLPNPRGPRDRDVDTLWLVAEDGATIGSLTVIGCHPTCRGGEEMGGDYPGFFCAALERELGGIHAFGLGCAGDVRPRFVTEAGKFRRAEMAEVKSAGEMLAEHARSVPRKVLEVNRVETRTKIVELRLDSHPSEERWRQMVRTDPNPLRREWAATMQGRSDLPTQIQAEFQAVHLHPGMTLVAWPGEVASGYAVWLKRRYAELETRRAVMVAAYSNGMVGYVPTRAMWPRGGYEVNGSHPYFGLPAPFARGVESQMRRGTLDLLAGDLNE